MSVNVKSKVFVVTHSPSPYQVELFNAVSQSHEITLMVVYLHRTDPARSWSQTPIAHSHIFLGMENDYNSLALKIVNEAHLLIVNYYQHPWSILVMNMRARMQAPWCFWGERPGFKYPRIGKYGRLWRLRALHQSNAPIWGVGVFAITAYKKEFGINRNYINFPYFSDLQRFSLGKQKSIQSEKLCVVLYSGTLTQRKGVDLLAKAFSKVAPKFPQLQLYLMGSGKLDKQLAAQLEPVAAQVQFIGFKDWKELPGIYASADVLCVPSRHDGWGLVVPEGLASGLPVIATRQMGAAVDLIKTGENGWLIKENDQKAIEDVLIKIANIGRPAVCQMSAAARQSVVSHTLEIGVNRFLAACTQTIASWSR